MSPAATRPRHRLVVVGCALALLGVTLGAGAAAAGTPAAGPHLSVDVTRNRHAISPDIYGVNFAGRGDGEEAGPDRGPLGRQQHVALQLQDRL